MADKFWVEQVVDRLNTDIARTLPHMRSITQAPPPRRPPVREAVKQAIADPASVDPTGRQYLLGRLRDKYGDMADMVAPYLGIPEEPEPIEPIEEPY